MLTKMSKRAKRWLTFPHPNSTVKREQSGLSKAMTFPHDPAANRALAFLKSHQHVSAFKVSRSAY